MMDVAVEIHCAACGSANYSLPDGGGEQAELRCNDCGRRLGSVPELRDELLQQALARSVEALRRDLDRLGQGEAA